MLVIPAINLLGGNVVRMRQGDPARGTVYDSDPLAVARRFVEAGARVLYVHDIDSLRGEGVPHVEIAARIAADTGAQVQFGATIDDVETLERVLEQPFETVEIHADHVIGTPFLHDTLARHADRVALRLDVRNGNVHLQTAERSGPADPVALSRELVATGAKRLVYSDLNRDGMLGGPNYAGLRALLSVTTVPVTVAGGIAHDDHIRNLERLGVAAAVIGKALLTGDLSLRGHLDEHGNWRR